MAPPTSTDLRRERADLASEMRGLISAAEGGIMTETQQARYDEMYTRQGDIEKTYTRLERQEALDAELESSRGTIAAQFAGPAGSGGVNDESLGSTAGGRATLMGFSDAGRVVLDRSERNHMIELRMQENYGEGIFGKELSATSTAAYRAAFRNYIRKGERGLAGHELRTLQEAVDPAGGYLVPEDVLSRIISREPAPTRINGRVTVITTQRDRIAAPRVNYSTDDIYTTGMRVTWTGEVPSSGTAHRVTDPVFGQLAIDVHTAMMSLPVTRDFVDDASFPVVSWITSKFGETIDLLRDNLTLNGTGVGQPHGILENPAGTNEPAVTNSGSAATLIATGLQDIVWDVPEQYEDNSAWVFNKNSTGKTIAKMVDTAGRFLWQPYEQSGLVGSRRADLLGYPVVMSAFAPNVSAGTYPVVFGDLRGYYRVDRLGLSVEVLRERYAEENQVVVLGRLRIGGDVAEPYRMRIQKTSA